MSYNSYSQYTGATPWSNCFGKNASCNYDGCSAIEVNTSSSSPVVAIVKKYGRVVKHAYISAGSRYTFEVKDGTYQIFFYYGTSWNEYKRMSSDECSSIYGGWEYNENVTKDNPITLSNQIMTYTLTSTVGGNFNTKGSSLKEAL
tara:strand:- start:1073 stop:1507 length:435 start_codon:yes stop_codon:yes gene_type:complete